MSNTLQLNRVAQLGVSIATGVEFNVILQQQRSSVRDSHAQPVIGFGGVNVIKSFFYLRQARYILVVLVLVVLVVVQTDVVAVEAVTAYDLCLIPQFQCSSGSQLLRCRVDDDSIGDIVRPVTIFVLQLFAGLYQRRDVLVHRGLDGRRLITPFCFVGVGDIRCEQVIPAGVFLKADLIPKLNDVLFSVVAAVHLYSQHLIIIGNTPSVSGVPGALLVVHVEPELVAVHSQLGSLRQGILDKNFACFRSRCHQPDAVQQFLILDIVIIHSGIAGNVLIPFSIDGHRFFKDTAAINILSRIARLCAAVLRDFCVVGEGPIRTFRLTTAHFMSGHIVQHHLTHSNGVVAFCFLHCNGKAQHMCVSIIRINFIIECIKIGDSQIFFHLRIVQCTIAAGQIQRQAIFNRFLQLRSNGIVSVAAIGGVPDGIGQLKMVGTGRIHCAQIPVGDIIIIGTVVGLGQFPDALTDGNRVLRPEVISYIRPVRHRCRAICRYSGLVGNGKAVGGLCVVAQF